MTIVNNGWKIPFIRDIFKLTDTVYSTSTQLRTDDPFSTATAGITNVKFGVIPWLQANYDASPYGVMPNTPWIKSGFRAIRGHITVNTDAGNTVYGGIGETGQIPDQVKPDFQEVTLDPKIVALTFGETLKQELLAGTEDDTYGEFAVIRNYMSTEYNYLLASSLMRDFESQTFGGDFSYKSTKDFTPYDQVISNHPEEQRLGGSNDGKYDAYNEYDRDSNDTAWDSTVVTGNEEGTIGGDNGFLDRGAFTKLNTEILNKSNMKPSFYLTDHNFHREAQHLYDGQTWYNGRGGGNTATVNFGFGGVNGYNGHSVQMEVSAIDGIPLIGTVHSCKNPGDPTQLGKLFAFNVSTPGGMNEPCIGMCTLLPTFYLENSPRGGAGNAWAFIDNKLISGAAFVQYAELVCRKPRAQGKMTDFMARG